MARKHLNIGGKIQARRKAMGLSQEDLAQLTGVSRQSVTKWETGQSAPDLDRLVEVSDVLGVSLDFLLREPQQVSSPTFFRCCGFPSVCRGWLAGRVRCSQRDRFFSEWDGPCRCCGARRFLWAGSRCSIRKEKPMAFWVSRNVPQHRFPGFRNVPPACRKCSLLNPPLPVSRRPLYALPVPMIPDFMVPIFGLSCAVPPRYAVSCCS